MKKLFIALLLLFMLSLNAQLLWEHSIPVRQSVNIEWGRSSAKTPDGAMVYVWSDVRRGDRDVYAQKVDGDGNMLWGEESTNSSYPGMKEGILVNGAADRQEDIVIIETGDGQTIVAWVDFRNDPIDGDIYAQKIDENGNLLWDQDGVPICLADDVQISLNIVSDENGGAYIIWLDSRFQTGPDIFGVHILSDGTLADGWEENGSSIITYDNSQNQHTFWEDGQGGAVLAWHDERDSGDANIYMQRIGEDGSLLWGENGTLLAGAVNEQSKPKVTRTSDNKFFFTWREKKDDTSGDIYAQLVDLDGNFLWSEDKVVFAGNGVQRNPRIQLTSDDCAAIIWEDGADEVNSKNLYAQKIDQEGNTIWGSSLQICNAESDQLNPRITADDDGGVWFIWDDSRDGDFPNVDIYVQHVDSSGNILLEPNGKQICTQYSEQFSPLIKKNENKIFAIWGNGNNETGARTLQVQILNEDGSEALPENGVVLFGGIAGNASNYKLLENGEHPIAIWEDSRDSHIANQNFMQVLNADGTFQLEKNGVSLTEMTNTNQENLDAVFASDEEKVAAVWTEGRVDGIDYVYAQLMDLDGNRLWAETGLEICDNELAQDYPQISYYNDEYYIAWADSRENWDFGVYMQKLDSNGNLLWDADGVEVADLAGDDILIDVVDNYVIWKNFVSFNNINLHVAKIDADGNMADGWPEDGIAICVASGNQENAKAVMTDQGLLVIWQDQRLGTADVYGQIIAADGSILCAEDGAALVTPNEDQLSSNPIWADGLFIAWDDLSGGDYDVYMQSYDTSANENWTAGGIDIATGENNQQVPYIVSNGSEFIVLWEDYFGGGETGATESNIKAQMVQSDGSVYWQESGIELTTAIKDQKKPIAVYDENNNAYVIWEDSRSSGKNDIYNLYAQYVGFTEQGTDDIEIPVYSNLKQNYPNPFNPTTTIEFSIPTQDEDIELAIYNVKGQKVKTLIHQNMNAGKHSVVWNGLDDNNKTVASGIYFYKLSSKNIYETKRMILMK